MWFTLRRTKTEEFREARRPRVCLVRGTKSGGYVTPKPAFTPVAAF